MWGNLGGLFGGGGGGGEGCEPRFWRVATSEASESSLSLRAERAAAMLTESLEDAIAMKAPN
jgi:hypothetical protein